MQIVIEIDEEEYKTYINHTEAILDSSIPLVHQDLLRAVINGTPLPKGHGDLIDRGKTVERICKVAEFMNEKKENLGSPYIMAALFIQDNKEEFPTIIEADGGDTETWNGYHGQVTAPKGTFKRIYADADGGDAE